MSPSHLLADQEVLELAQQLEHARDQVEATAQAYEAASRRAELVGTAHARREQIAARELFAGAAQLEQVLLVRMDRHRQAVAASCTKGRGKRGGAQCAA